LKLLFTQDALVNAGAERSHLEILARFSPDTEAALVYFYPKQELKSEYEKAGVRLIFLDIPETYHFPLAISRLVRLIRTEKPDLLISCLWRADIITRIASWITGVPLLGTLVNDSYSPIAWKDKKGLKYKVVYWLDRLTAGIPVHWIANAQALADSHVKTLGLPREKITVVYRGRPVIARTRYSLPRTNVGEDEAIFSIENSFNQETASAAEDLSEKAGSIESSLAVTGVTGDVIAREVRPKQSSSDKTASSADDLSEKEGSIESSLAVTGVTGDVIAREVRPKQSSSDKTASAADNSSEKAVSVVSGLAMMRNFISYGRLLERKGFQDAIHAFAQVLKIYPDCTLTIFGEGPFRKELENQIQNLGLQDSVFLPGKISNPMEILLSGYSLPTDHFSLITANYFLFPSWYEGFSGALVEAMMAGVPIIASDIPMNLEAVTDGKTALTFKVGDPQDLFSKMKVVLEHPEQMAAMGEEARKEAEARFDIEKIAREYEGVVKRISPPRPFPQELRDRLP